MVGLKLRHEFLGAHMPGTAISLRTSDNQGAVQKSPDEVLSITYPTADVQVALKSLSAKRVGRPIVLIGDRGRGKSHILAVMHHAVNSPDIVEKWIQDWGGRLDSADLRGLMLTRGFIPISEPVHNHEFALLWNLLFERHPKGEYYRGQFEQLGQPYPPRTLLEKMFEEAPTCLILDEFQTWFAGLPEKDPKTGFMLRQWAFNFIQNLSEIAKDRPQHLILVVSVLNNQSDAFRQIHRLGPLLIDFQGPSAKKDRQRLLLHRIFENRNNIGDDVVSSVVQAYAQERFRLLHPGKSESERARIQNDVTECWPFSPELLDLLEDHILLSQAAQETRDLIRILAQLYRSRGAAVPVLTAADFFVDGETDEVQSLVDSISHQAGQEKLRQIAQRNLVAVREAGVPSPNARELISAIWMRSMSPGKLSGGTPMELHLDVTRDRVLDDNAFQAELNLLIENSVNIHGDERPGGALRFDLQDNPRSKVRACSKNSKLWAPNAVSSGGQTVYPGKDIEHIRKTLKHILVPETRQSAAQVIVLGPSWESNPWGEVSELEVPAKWTGPVLLVIPDAAQSGSANMGQRLGPWLAAHVSSERNTVRFLVPAPDSTGLFTDSDLLYSARCGYLCSKEAWGADATYRSLNQEFDRQLRQSLKSRFTRFAVLRKWDFQQPGNCVFDVEKLDAQATDIPSTIEAKILADIFDPTAFRAFVLERAKESDFIRSILADLSEPPPKFGDEAIPYLGETQLFEEILKIAAAGDIVLNVGGTWFGRKSEHENESDALHFLRSKTFRTGQELRQIQLGLPGAAGGSAVPGAGTSPSSKPAPGPVPPNVPGAQPPASPAVPCQPSGSSAAPAAPSATPPAKPVLESSNMRRTAESASGLNLTGFFEAWNIPASQTLDRVHIEFEGLNVQQAKLILQKIPSVFKAKLEIGWKEFEG